MQKGKFSSTCNSYCREFFIDATASIFTSISFFLLLPFQDKRYTAQLKQQPDSAVKESESKKEK